MNRQELNDDNSDTIMVVIAYLAAIGLLALVGFIFWIIYQLIR
jgi:hypothetical protein